MNTHPVLRSFFRVAVVTALLLSVPLIAMQFTPEVDWSTGDFLVAATLLLSAGMAIVLGVRRANSVHGKVWVVAAVLALLLLVWAQLAVGLFS